MMHMNLHDTLIGGTLGFANGFVLNKAGAYKTRSIRSVFEMKDLSLLKTCGTAVATGCVAMAVTSALGYTTIRIKPTYAWSNLIGGTLVGAGTYLAGSSLEAALGQVGAGKRRGAIALAGGLTGALAYGLLDHGFRGSIFGESGQVLALHTMLDLPFAYVAIPFAALVAGVVYLMEGLSPTTVTTETTKQATTENAVAALESDRWSPYVCGVLLGLLQVPTTWNFGNVFGIASPYFSTAATLIGVTGVTNLFYELYKLPEVYWTFPLGCGSIVGSGTSEVMKAKKKTKTSVPLTSSQQMCTFAGTFITALGTGMAIGGPSVQGLAGVSQLSVGSILTMLGVLGGGVVTATLMSDKRAEI